MSSDLRNYTSGQQKDSSKHNVVRVKESNTEWLLQKLSSHSHQHISTQSNCLRKQVHQYGLLCERLSLRTFIQFQANQWMEARYIFLEEPIWLSLISRNYWTHHACVPER